MSSRVSCGDPVAYGESIGVGLYRASCFFLILTGTASRRVPRASATECRRRLASRWKLAQTENSIASRDRTPSLIVQSSEQTTVPYTSRYSALKTLPRKVICTKPLIPICKFSSFL